MSSKGERLAEYVLQRRTELDLNQIEVWQAGGPSNTTLSDIENGRMETLTRTTARKLDAGLKWEPGSARRLWDGGEPTPLLPGASPRNSATIRAAIEASDLPPEKRERLLQVLDETG